MKQVSFSSTQTEFICRAIASYGFYLAEEHNAILGDHKSIFCELAYRESSPTSSGEKALLRDQVHKNIGDSLKNLCGLLKVLKEDGESFDCSEDELNELGNAVHIYGFHILQPFIKQLEKRPDEEALILAWLPAVDMDEISEQFDEFVENRTCVSFFQKEFDYGVEILQYLESVSPNMISKRESEPLDVELGLILENRKAERAREMAEELSLTEESLEPVMRVYFAVKKLRPDLFQPIAKAL